MPQSEIDHPVVRRRTVWLPDALWGQVRGEAEIRRSELHSNGASQVVQDALTLYFRVKERNQNDARGN